MNRLQAKTSYIILIIFICIICGIENNYGQSEPNISLLNNKGEIKIDAYVAGSAIGLTISYSMVNHFFICANGVGEYTHVDNYWDDPRITSTFSSFQGDIGGGYYRKIYKSLTIDALAGVGFGNSSYDDVSYYSTTTAYGHLFRVYAQTDIGVSLRNFETGIGIKLSNINGFSNDEEIDYPGVWQQPTSTIINDVTGDALILEPCLFASAGAKNIKIKISAGISNKIWGTDKQYGYTYPTVNFNLGLTMDINRKPN